MSTSLAPGAATKWDRKFDVVCVGSGAGGLTAAITASLDELSVLVVEKGSLLGGVTACGQGELWVGDNHLATQQGITDSKHDTLAYLDFLAVGLGDADLRRTFVERSDEAIRFLQHNADLQLRVIHGRPDWHYPDAPGSKAEGRYLEVAPFDARQLGALQSSTLISPHGFADFTQQDLFDSGGSLDSLRDLISTHTANHELCSGSGLSARLLKSAADRGVELMVDTTATRLIVEDGVVVGLELSTTDGTQLIRAGAVVLATGGYDWNADLVRTFEHLAVTGSLVPPTVTGDHMTMAGEIGAMIASRPPALTPLIPGMSIPGEEYDGAPMYHFAFAGKPHSIYVNSAGKRIGDESFYPDIDAKLANVDGSTLTYPNRPIWLVFDENFREKYPVGGTILPGQPMPAGLAAQGESPTDVAARAGIDPAGLEVTIGRFNQFCADGRDQDFRRGERVWSLATFGDATMPNPVLGALDKPPFYAIELVRVSAGIPSAGLRIDPDARVMNTRGHAIGGLYAAGNTAAPLDFIGYQSGISISRALTYGYLAAKHLAKSIGSAEST